MYTFLEFRDYSISNMTVSILIFFKLSIDSHEFPCHLLLTELVKKDQSPIKKGKGERRFYTGSHFQNEEIRRVSEHTSPPRLLAELEFPQGIKLAD